MNTIYYVLVNLFITLVVLAGLVWMQKKHLSFTLRVLVALAAGIILGGIGQMIYGTDSDIISNTNSWIVIVSSLYIRLLKMIVFPLIFVSITSAIVTQKSKNIGKIAGLIISVLIVTTAIAASVGAGTAHVFELNAENFQGGENEIHAGEAYKERLDSFQATSIQQQLIEIIPTNPFQAFTGQGRASALSVVVIAVCFSIAVLGIKKKKPESQDFLIKLITALHDVVMRLVTLILRLTPYGVFALMIKVVSTSPYVEILRLFGFVVASYVAIGIMFVIHFIILACFGLDPLTYLKKTMHVLMFAFTSRTSAGTLPLNIEAQTNRLGVSEGFANLSASLGTSIGQNGCAGIYPAMMTVMIAPTVGINPLDPSFLIKLIIVTALASFGIAGVGGGATFASLTVLSTMGLPVDLVGLFIAIEPLIDMARTALNVSGSMVSGLVSSRLMKEIDLNRYRQKQVL